MDSWGLQVFVFWPGVVIAAALLNMLISWTFSWSELIFDYMIGAAIGACFFAGTEADAGAVENLFLVWSQGLFGLLHVMDPEMYGGRETFFLAAAIATVGCTAATAGLDRAALSINGGQPSVGNGVLSIFIWLLKAPFNLLTSAVGLLFVLVGLIRWAAAPATGKVGFLGGVFYVEWKNGGNVSSATTLGSTVQTWKGDFPRLADHELYHSRQYIYMRDWLIPAWVLGGLWGLASAAAAGTPGARCFQAARHDKEVGNPIERAAYRISGYSNCP